MKKVVFVLFAGIMVVDNAHAQKFGWAKQFGNASYDEGGNVTIDNAGNIYTIGRFESTVDFDPGPATFNLTSAGSYDVFISKLDSNGSLIWAMQFGGSQVEVGSSIAVDIAGNVYASGSFQDTAYFSSSAFNLISSGDDDVFIVKIDAFGNLIWTKKFGGIERDYENSIAIDADGKVYTSGFFSHRADFDPGTGTFELFAPVGSNSFIAKLDSLGNFVWAKQFEGLYSNSVQSIFTDAVGNVYATGSFWGTADLDPGLGSFNLISYGYNDVFVVKLDASGNLIWAGQFGGTQNDVGHSIVTDAGNVYITGFFSETTDFDAGPDSFNLSSAGGMDVFVTKLDTLGNLVWAKQFGEAGDEHVQSIAIDTAGGIYITGYFWGMGDFDPGPETFYLSSSGGSDIFIAKLDNSGSLSWVDRLGGQSNDSGSSVTVDAFGNFYVTGFFQGIVDFNPGPATFNLNSSGHSDVFVLKMEPAIIISGTILTEAGIPVSQVTVTLAGEDTCSTTTADGRYNFLVEPGGSYTITPSKSNDSISTNGVTLIDALLMRRHSLGIMPLSSPYKIIAAAEVNADGDTTITTQDILFTRSLILGNISSFPTNRLWQFVSSDYVFPDNKHPFPFDKTRTYTNITTNQTNQNFIGIKLGDVNGSWDD